MIKRLLLIAVLLLVAVPAFAQDQSLAPTGENNDATVGVGNDTDCSVTFCDAAACDDEVDDDPASPDALELVTDTNNAIIIFTFPTPSANPSTAAGAQNVDVNFTRTLDCVESSDGTDPVFSLTLYCSGVSKLAITTNQAITAEDERDSTNTFTYTTDGDCDAAGVNVEIGVTLGKGGGGGSLRRASLNAIEWEVTHVAAGGRTRRTF